MKLSKRLFAQLGVPRARTQWDALAKLVTARFVRGNTAAQFASILFPKEQDAQRKKAEDIAQKWEKQAGSVRR